MSAKNKAKGTAIELTAEDLANVNGGIWARGPDLDNEAPGVYVAVKDEKLIRFGANTDETYVKSVLDFRNFIEKKQSCRCK